MEDEVASVRADSEWLLGRTERALGDRLVRREAGVQADGSVDT